MHDNITILFHRNYIIILLYLMRDSHRSFLLQCFCFHSSEKVKEERYGHTVLCINQCVNMTHGAKINSRPMYTSVDYFTVLTETSAQKCLTSSCHVCLAVEYVLLLEQRV